MKNIGIFYFFIAIVVVAAIILGFNRWSQSDSNDPVKIGYLAIGAGLPLFVAEEEGFFAEQSVEVELIEFRSSNDIASAAVAGRIDVIGTGATNAMLDANTARMLAFACSKPTTT